MVQNTKDPKEVRFTHFVIAPEVLHQTEETIEIEVTGGHLWTFVDGRPAVVHELIQLSHKPILLFAWLIVRRLKKISIFRHDGGTDKQ